MIAILIIFPILIAKKISMIMISDYLKIKLNKRKECFCSFCYQNEIEVNQIDSDKILSELFLHPKIYQLKQFIYANTFKALLLGFL